MWTPRSQHTQGTHRQSQATILTQEQLPVVSATDRELSGQEHQQDTLSRGAAGWGVALTPQ